MGSVPLAALSIQTNPPSPLDQYARAMQIKNLGFQQQLQPGELQSQQNVLQDQQLGLQQKKLQIQSQQGIKQALIDSGGDKDKFFGNIANPKYGVLPSDQFAVQKQHQEMQDSVAKTDKDTLEATQAAHTQLTQHLNNVLQAPPEDQEAQYTLERNAIMRDPTLQKYAQQIPPQFPGAQALTTIDNGMKLSSQLLAEAKQKNEAPGQVAHSQQEQQEAALGPQGRAAMTSPTLQSQADWLAKHPGKGPSDYEIAMKKIVPQFNLQMQSSLLSPEAQQMAAQNYSQTGQLPAGMRSPAMASSILNTAAGAGGGAPNIAANKANYKANTGSLDSLQKNFDQVTAFENTAGKNLDTFLNTAKKVVDSGSPLINQPLRAVAGKVTGSPDQAAYDAARTTALTEIAKVLNSSNASGVLSDSARSEVSGLIGKDATLKQIYSAAGILKQDMANRHQAYQSQIQEIQGRISGQPAQQSQAQSQAQHVPGGKAGLTEGATGTGSDGKKYVVKGGVWVPQ